MNTYSWYQTLIKPSWAPPASVFGPVWTVLYIIIAVTFVYSGYLFFKGKIPFIILLPFVLNIIFNLAFTPIQFGLQNNFLAAVDILLVLGTLIWALVAIYPHAAWVALANIPYLLWVLFATTLQLTITYLNWGK
jgi:translocator protein